MVSLARLKKLLKEFHLFAFLKLIYKKDHCNKTWGSLASLNPRQAVRVVDDRQWREEGICVMLISKYWLLAPMLWPREGLLSTLFFLAAISFFLGWREERGRGREKTKLHLLPLCRSVFIQEVREHIFPLRILPDPSVDPQHR